MATCEKCGRPADAVKWRAMDAAPRDGSRVLAASSLGGRPLFVEIVKWSAEDRRWVSWYGTQVVQPTYFMLLPDPPEVDG